MQLLQKKKKKGRETEKNDKKMMNHIPNRIKLKMSV